MNKYKVILTVYEEKNISKAAEKLNYTHSAISQTIKSYENRLGITLFHRTKQGMLANPYCEGIFDSLKIVCSELDHMEHIARDLHSIDHGKIRIGTIQSVAYHWLPDLLKDFSEKYPNVDFRMSVDGFQGLHKRLENREVDLIYTTSVAAEGITFIPLFKDEMMLVTPLDHPLADRLYVPFADIKKEPYILPSDELDYETGELFRQNRIKPQIRYRLNDDYAVLKMVEQGFGITILPKLLIQNAPFDICVRPFAEHFYRTIGIAFNPMEGMPRVIKEFVNHVKEYTKEME